MRNYLSEWQCDSDLDYEDQFDDADNNTEPDDDNEPEPTGYDYDRYANVQERAREGLRG